MGSTTISVPTQVKMKAARCKHGDLFIFIDTHKTIYADSQEHVPSDVHFYAAAGGMTLYFEDNKVFDPTVSLNQGDNLLTPKAKGSTRYAIDRLPTDKPTANRSGDPILVVP